MRISDKADVWRDFFGIFSPPIFCRHLQNEPAESYFTFAYLGRHLSSGIARTDGIRRRYRVGCRRRTARPPFSVTYVRRAFRDREPDTRAREPPRSGVVPKTRDDRDVPIKEFFGSPGYRYPKTNGALPHRRRVRPTGINARPDAVGRTTTLRVQFASAGYENTPSANGSNFDRSSARLQRPVRESITARPRVYNLPPVTMTAAAAAIFGCVLLTALVQLPVDVRCDSHSNNNNNSNRRPSSSPFVTPSGMYVSSYDHIDVNRLLRNEKLVTAYIKCFLGDGPCTADGRQVKSKFVFRSRLQWLPLQTAPQSIVPYVRPFGLPRLWSLLPGITPFNGTFPLRSGNEDTPLSRRV